MAALSSTRKRTSIVWDYFELIEVVDEKGKKIKMLLLSCAME